MTELQSPKKPRRKKPKRPGKRGVPFFHELKRTDPRRLKHEAEVAQCLQLRIDGWSMRQIATAMNMALGKVHKILDAAIKDLGADQKAQDIRAVAIARLDSITTGVLPNAVKGDGIAVSAFLAVQRRQLDLAGIETEKSREPGPTATAVVELKFGVDDEKL